MADFVEDFGAFEFYYTADWTDPDEFDFWSAVFRGFVKRVADG